MVARVKLCALCHASSPYGLLRKRVSRERVELETKWHRTELCKLISYEFKACEEESVVSTVFTGKKFIGKVNFFLQIYRESQVSVLV